MFRKLCKRGATGIAATCLLLAGTSAQAVPTTEIGLGIDGSGSISSSDFDLQIDAYKDTLTDPTILPQDGSVAVGIWLFSSGITNLYPTTVIDSSTVGGLAAALTGVVQPGSLTDIAGTIDTIANDLITNGIDSDRQVIDISTDGQQTTFGNPDTSAANAVDGGIEQVNCLGIGSSADCGFTAGTGSFHVIANSFNDFGQALENKIVRETTTVPVPATLLLFSLGLLGLGAARVGRRMA